MWLSTHGPVVLANVRVVPPKGLNTTYYLDVNNFARHTGWAHGFMHAYALWLGLVLLVLLFLLAYAVIWWRRDHHAAALMGLGGIGTLIALGLNQLVGHAVKEVRPYDTFHHALVLVGRANDYAFPSDHAVIAGAIVTSLWLVLRRGAPEERPAYVLGGSVVRLPGSSLEPELRVVGAMAWIAVVCTVLGLFLCFSRVYVGAHYPGDVVAGFVLGFVVVGIVTLFRPIAYWLADAIESTPLGVLVRRPPGPSLPPQEDPSSPAEQAVT